MSKTPMTAGLPKMAALREGAARLSGQVIAVDGAFTTVKPMMK